MPRSSLDDLTTQSHLLNDLSASHTFQAEYNSSDVESAYTTRRSARPFLCHLLAFFGLSGRTWKGRYDLDDVPTLAYLQDGRWTSSSRELRRFRPSVVFRFLLRAARALPIFILIFFGVVHILEAVVGRTRLLWNSHLYRHASSVRLGTVHGEAGGLTNGGGIPRGVVPIPCNSHNDYWRDEPLFDAIRWGCTSVEADVWLFDGELYVGHSPAALAEDRTLRTLYINPLVQLLDKSGSASGFATSASPGIFDSEPSQTLVLLIDFKGDGRAIFPVVEQQLQPLRERGLLSYWNGEKLLSRAVTVVGTGNTPIDMVMSNNTFRDIFLDAPLPVLWEAPREPIGHTDLLHSEDGDIDYGTAMSVYEEADADPTSSDVNANLFNTSTSYYASTSFASAVGFVWRGHLSPRQMNLIRGQIRGAKRRGLKARYWNTPTWPAALRNHVWHVLMKEGADVLNVDDLKAAALQDWTVPAHDTFI